MLVEDETEFETEEAWLGECQDVFLRLKTDTEDYLKQVTTLHEKKEVGESQSTISKNVAGNADNHTQNGSGSAASQEENLLSNEIITEENPGLTETIQSSVNVNIQTEGSEFGGNGHTEGNHGNSEHCSFRMEKPQMPKFYGDVREYFIFTADFKHSVEAR